MTFIDGDFFESISDISFGDMYTSIIKPDCDRIIDVYNNINRTPILFIETSGITLLLDEVSKLDFDVIIICHNSDITINNVFDTPNNVIKLWCQNYNGIDNDIIKPLPIGLERKMWFVEQNKQGVIESIDKNKSRINKCYMNFSIDTNSIRKQWRDYLINKDFIVSEMLGNGNDYNKYCDNLTKYKFIISPPGNGIDCHRNWEALYMNCVPIIQKSNFTNNMFGDMSVILVDDFIDINEELILNYTPNINNDKLSTTYWEKIIRLDVK